MAASPNQSWSDFDFDFEPGEVNLESVRNMVRGLTGVYIAKGKHGFYMFSFAIAETRDDSVIFTVQNIATPFRLDPDDMAKITSTRCFNVTVTAWNDSDATAQLDTVQHNPLCGLGKSLPRGEAGTVDIVTTGLQLISELFGIEEFPFVDASEIGDISLRKYSLLTTGKTWYARHFPRVTAKYDSDVDRLAECYIATMRFVTRPEINAIWGRLSNESKAAIGDKLITASDSTTWRAAFGRLPIESFTGDMVKAVEQVLKINTDVFFFEMNVASAPGQEYSNLKKYRHVYH